MILYLPTHPGMYTVVNLLPYIDAPQVLPVKLFRKIPRSADTINVLEMLPPSAITMMMNQPRKLLIVTGVPGLVHSHLFYISNCTCGLCFLVDTSVVVSVLPPSHTECQQHERLTLQTANGSPIATFCTQSLTLNVGLPMHFLLAVYTS